MTLSNFSIRTWCPDLTQDSLSAKALIAMYQQAFADSSNADEGNMVADLVAQIIADNAYVCHIAVCDDDAILGAACWTPMSCKSNDQPLSAYLLSPVAVKTTHQDLKIGQQLIQYGLTYLSSQGIDLVLSYGDLNYYQKLGFKPLSIHKITPPYPLSMPFGWIGQSLSQDDIDTINIHEPPICVPAFCSAALW